MGKFAALSMDDSDQGGGNGAAGGTPSGAAADPEAPSGDAEPAGRGLHAAAAVGSAYGISLVEALGLMPPQEVLAAARRTAARPLAELRRADDASLLTR